MEKISPKIVKDIEKSRFLSRSRDICQFFEGFNFGFGEFGLGKKSICFGFGKFGLKKNLCFGFGEFVSEKSIDFGFRKFDLGKKVLVPVLENLVSEKNLGIGFGQNFGIVIQWSYQT